MVVARLFAKLVRVIRPHREDGGRDAIFRRLRLLAARMERNEELTNKAQRRADSAWTAVTRVQSNINATKEVAPGPTIPGAVPDGAKAGTSLSETLRNYNRHITGG